MKQSYFAFKKTYLTDIATIQISTIKILYEECFNKNKLPITMLVALSEKKFGANGFMLRQLLINMRKQRLV
jgi:hypothetical protein